MYSVLQKDIALRILALNSEFNLQVDSSSRSVKLSDLSVPLGKSAKKQRILTTGPSGTLV